MKTKQKVNTKLDGIQPVELWSKDEFTGRSIQIYSEKDAQTIPVSDDTILCDFCNEQITEFPVPIIFNNALCPKCYKEVIM